MQTLTTVDKSNPTIWLFIWSASDKFSENEWKMWVDVEHGFTPVRYENRERETGHDSWWMIQTYKTKWDQKDAVWVPVRHEIVMTPNKGKWRQEIAFDVKWENINQPIGNDIFDYTGFGAPDTVSVIDATLTQPVVIKAGVNPSEKGAPVNPDRRKLILWGLAVGLALMAVFYFRRVIQQRRSDPKAGA